MTPYYCLTVEQQTDVNIALSDDYELWEIIYASYEFDDNGFTMEEGPVH